MRNAIEAGQYYLVFLYLFAPMWLIFQFSLSFSLYLVKLVPTLPLPQDFDEIRPLLQSVLITWNSVVTVFA